MTWLNILTYVPLIFFHELTDVFWKFFGLERHQIIHAPDVIPLN